MVACWEREGGPFPRSLACARDVDESTHLLPTPFGPAAASASRSSPANHHTSTRIQPLELVGATRIPPLEPAGHHTSTRIQPLEASNSSMAPASSRDAVDGTEHVGREDDAYAEHLLFHRRRRARSTAAAGWPASSLPETGTLPSAGGFAECILSGTAFAECQIKYTRQK